MDGRGKRLSRADHNRALSLVRGWREAEPGLSQTALAARLTEAGLGISQPAVGKMLRKLGLTGEEPARARWQTGEPEPTAATVVVSGRPADAPASPPALPLPSSVTALGVRLVEELLPLAKNPAEAASVRSTIVEQLGDIWHRLADMEEDARGAG